LILKSAITTSFSHFGFVSLLSIDIASVSAIISSLYFDKTIFTSSLSDEIASLIVAYVGYYVYNNKKVFKAMTATLVNS